MLSVGLLYIVFMKLGHIGQKSTFSPLKTSKVVFMCFTSRNKMIPTVQIIMNPRKIGLV